MNILLKEKEEVPISKKKKKKSVKRRGSRLHKSCHEFRITPTTERETPNSEGRLGNGGYNFYHLS